MNFTKKDFIYISLTLFSMFFGAGNLIFPPMLGANSGTNLLLVFIPFFISAAIFPILGVVAVSKSKGLRNLCERVSPRFAVFFITFILLAIGPLLAIPRNASVPFEMTIYPLISDTVQKGSLHYHLLLGGVTTVFFIAAFYFAKNPNKLVQRLGKIMSPILIGLIITLFVASLFKPMGDYQVPAQIYSANPVVRGFLDGYETLDVTAAITYGTVILVIFKQFNLKEEKTIKLTILTGMCACLLLGVIYLMSAHLGAMSVNLFPNPSNGAAILRNVSYYLLGDIGLVFIAVIFSIACFSVVVALLISCSKFFHDLYNKISYNQYLIAITIVSYVLANYGLSKILEYSIPVLLILYPPALVLICLVLVQKWIGKDVVVYKSVVYVTLIVSTISTLPMVPLLKLIFTKNNFLVAAINMLPLAKEGLPWLVPAFITFVVATISRVIYLKSQNKTLLEFDKEEILPE